MTIALEAGAEDIKTDNSYHEVTCDPSCLEAVKAALTAKHIPLVTAEITMIPNSTIKVVGEEAKNVLALMEALEEHEDIQNVYANFDIADEEIEKMAKQTG